MRRDFATVGTTGERCRSKYDAEEVAPEDCGVVKGGESNPVHELGTLMLLTLDTFRSLRDVALLNVRVVSAKPTVHKVS